MNDFFLYILSALLMLVGAVGTLVPLVPGVPFMFLVSLGYALLTSFLFITTGELFIFGALAFLALLNDYIASAVGASLGGASKRSIGFAILGFFVGLILLPPWGGIIGAIGAVFVSELVGKHGGKMAIRAAVATFLGSLAGALANFILALVFFILFLFLGKP